MLRGEREVADVFTRVVECPIVAAGWVVIFREHDLRNLMPWTQHSVAELADAGDGRAAVDDW